MTLRNRGFRDHRDPQKHAPKLGKNSGAVNRFKEEMDVISNKHTQPRKDRENKVPSIYE